MTLPNDNIPAMIVPMILNRLREELEQKLQIDTPEDSPIHAALVKVGRLQENPLKVNVNVAISGGDSDDPEFLDGRIDHDALNQIGIRNLPVGEVGGGIYWWRRGTIKFQCYFVREHYDEDRALQYAYEFYGLVQGCVEDVNLTDLVDNFGERAYANPFVESCSFFESGGANKYIWRGKLSFRCLTWRP
jgi:hypothetical protein